VRHDEIPRSHELAWLASSIEIPGLSGPQATQLVQMLVLDHQRITMLLQKEPDARGRQRRSELHGVRDNGIEVEEEADGRLMVHVKGVDVFDPTTGEIRSDGSDGIACWFIDTDYNEESFFVRHAYFLGQNDPYGSLKTTLKAEIDADVWATLNSAVSRPFPVPKSGRIAVKVINHLGDEVMKVFRVE